MCHDLQGTHRAHAPHTHTHTESRETFMAEGLFALSIRSRCELSGRGDINRARERGERGRKEKDGVRKKAIEAKH